MILIEDNLELHKKSIVDFGGSQGIRDQGLLDSAIARPFQTFGGEELYQNIFEKAAAVAESSIINHPFVDGNKRTGLLAMVSLLINHNYRLTAKSENLYDFIINISTGTASFNETVKWLRENTVENI